MTMRYAHPTPEALKNAEILLQTLSEKNKTKMFSTVLEIKSD